ncbi:hypothetical protein F3Y22_tig00111206pilonHSYRG00050 [Hibiscus syriacus]|uniref:Initiation factor eIF2 gamma C-terminal domain-containing protein n=1 Tax=Hibiscus syriacus TaxID=106335 RepID=A0A6A2YVS7_HIBSY|nr:hypothetical protein F3Y22_tig00111206pilonHSYRG00050 [Hibiscus syriacus]
MWWFPSDAEKGIREVRKGVEASQRRDPNVEHWADVNWARVVAVKNDLAKLQLTSPVSTSKGENTSPSRRVEKHWCLIGWGKIQAGTTLEVRPCPLRAPV